MWINVASIDALRWSMMCKWIQAELDHALAKKGARKWQKSRYNKAICSSSLGKSDDRPRCEGDDLQPAFAMDHQRFGSTHGYVGVSGNGWLPSTMAIWIGLMLRPHDCLPAMPDSKQPQPQLGPQWPLHYWWPIGIGPTEPTCQWHHGRALEAVGDIREGQIHGRRAVAWRNLPGDPSMM